MEMAEILTGQMKFAVNNFCNNLDFIPDDKLNWKPAPTANSALEIANHLSNALYGIPHLLGGDETSAQWTPATNREEAKTLLQKGADNYIAQLQKLTPQDLARTVTLPLGELPLPVAAGIPVVEMINHHGQITYIQTLLGDTESHLLIG